MKTYMARYVQTQIKMTLTDNKFPVYSFDYSECKISLHKHVPIQCDGAKYFFIHKTIFTFSKLNMNSLKTI